jgi:hypothetical protein
MSFRTKKTITTLLPGFISFLSPITKFPYSRPFLLLSKFPKASTSYPVHVTFIQSATWFVCPVKDDGKKGSLDPKWDRPNESGAPGPDDHHFS